MAKGDGIDVLLKNLAELTGEGISLVLSPHQSLQLRWTVWTTGEAFQNNQIGAGETILYALKSAYDNTVQDIFKQKEG